MTATLERRLGAVEKRMGIRGNPLAQLSDADLDAILEMIYVHLAAQGDAKSIDALAAGDAEEAGLRAFYERPDMAGHCTLTLEEGVRWPYLRARARSLEEQTHYRGPRSARTEVELQQKINAVFATLGARL